MYECFLFTFFFWRREWAVRVMMRLSFHLKYFESFTYHTAFAALICRVIQDYFPDVKKPADCNPHLLEVRGQETSNCHGALQWGQIKWRSQKGQDNNIDMH